MRIIFIVTAVLILCGGCCVKKENNNIPSKDKPSQEESGNEKKQMVGGWYPVFFDKFDQTKVDSIIDSIKKGRVKRINISYDKNKKLAEQIEESIQKELNFAVIRDQVENKDTKTVKFDHDRVIVTVFQ